MIQSIPDALPIATQDQVTPRVTVRDLFASNSLEARVVTPPHFSLGRAADCDLVVNCSFASRHHCVLKTQGSHVTVRDLGSRNGTFLNRVRIQGETELQNGDTLVVGLQVFEITIETEPSSLGFVSTAPPAPTSHLCTTSLVHGE